MALNIKNLLKNPEKLTKQKCFDMSRQYIDWKSQEKPTVGTSEISTGKKT